MKVGIVYTSTTPELIQLVERELTAALGAGAEFVIFEDPSILAEARDAGYVTSTAAARLVSLFMDAVDAGADAILNCCSSVGEVADAVQDLARYTGIPIVRIDEEMCREAVRSAWSAGSRGRIAVMATLPTTLEPTKNTIRRVAREMNRRVTLVDALVEGAFGLSQDAFKSKMLTASRAVADKADVILFAQGSMAYCEDVVGDACGKPVLSSPRFGAGALRAALAAKGLFA